MPRILRLDRDPEGSTHAAGRPIQLEMERAWSAIGRRIVVATHRRSGTHLTLDLLRRQFPECRARKRLGEGVDTLYLNLDRVGHPRRPLSEARALELLSRAPRPLVKTHEPTSRPTAATDFRTRVLADADLLYVVRDGRDVLCSLFAYVRGYDPGAPASLSEFLRQDPGGESRVAYWARHVREGMAVPGALALRYEDLRASPQATLTRLGAVLALEPRFALPLLPRPLRGRWGSRLRRLLRDPEATSVPGGRPPDWRRAFTPDDRAFFQREAGDVLALLGYEASDAWVRERAA